MQIKWEKKQSGTQKGSGTAFELLEGTFRYAGMHARSHTPTYARMGRATHAQLHAASESWRLGDASNHGSNCWTSPHVAEAAAIDAFLCSITCSLVLSSTDEALITPHRPGSWQHCSVWKCLKPWPNQTSVLSHDCQGKPPLRVWQEHAVALPLGHAPRQSRIGNAQ